MDYKRIIKFNHEKDVKEKILFFKKFAIFSQWSFASLKTLAQISAIRKYPIGAALIIEGKKKLVGLLR